MATDNRSDVIVVGAFENVAGTEQAIQELRMAGFGDDQFGFAMLNDGITAGDLAPEDEVVTDTAGGAISGGILGGIVGAAVALLVPGIGPVLTGGILAAMLGGIVVGAAAGGIFGALTGMGISEEEAWYYQQAFEAGRAILAVKVNEQQNPQEVRAIMFHYGIDFIGVSSESSASSVTANVLTEGADIPPIVTASSTAEQRTATTDEMRRAEP